MSREQMIGPWWRLPGAPLRTSVARAIIVASLGTLVIAVGAGSWVAGGPDYVARCLVTFGAITLVAAGRLEAHHPYPVFGAANSVTLIRVGLVAAATALIGEPATERAAWLAVMATILVGLLDGFDGWLARRTGLASAFGARFDMEIDAFLILVLSVLVWRHDKAGGWVLMAGLMRYVFVAAGWLIPWVAGPLRSTVRGKAVAIAQFVGLGAALSPIVPLPYSAIVAAVTVAALGWSFAVDLVWLWRRYGEAA